MLVIALKLEGRGGAKVSPSLSQEEDNSCIEDADACFLEPLLEVLLDNTNGPENRDARQ